MEDDIVHVWVKAPPIDGRAIFRVEKVLARMFNVPKSRVRVTSGAAARSKIVEIEGAGRDDVREVLDSP